MFFDFELLDVVSGVVGLDQDGDRKDVTATVQIAHCVFHGIGSALVDYLEVTRGIVGEKLRIIWRAWERLQLEMVPMTLT